MAIIEITSDEQWHAERRLGIGGSDAAATMGMSKWISPYLLWLEKTTGERTQEQNTDDQKRGKILEKGVLEWYQGETGYKLDTSRRIVRSEASPFMQYTPDATVIGQNRLVQVKTARKWREWGDPGTDEIPLENFVQTQHELMVSGYEVADVPVLTSSLNFALYTVYADPELQAMMRAAEAEFWELVKSNTPPAPMDLDDVKVMYRKSEAKAVEATPEVVDYWKELGIVKAAAEELKAQKDDLEFKIQNYMGLNDTLKAGKDTLATWRQSKGRAGFDAEGVKKDHPDIHAKYVKVGASARTFLLKQL